jgi:hypothetical protein
VRRTSKGRRMGGRRGRESVRGKEAEGKGEDSHSCLNASKILGRICIILIMPLM